MPLLTDNEWGNSTSSGKDRTRGIRGPRSSRPPQEVLSGIAGAVGTAVKNKVVLVALAVVALALVLFFVGKAAFGGGDDDGASGAAAETSTEESSEPSEVMTLGDVSSAVDALAKAETIHLVSELSNPTAQVDISYYTDGREGAGTISAGGAEGKVAVRDGTVYISGPVELWRGLDVTVSTVDGWVAVPPDFAGENIAPSVTRLADTLILKHSSVAGPGWKYRTKDGSATVNPAGHFRNIQVGDLSTVPTVGAPVEAVDVGPIDPTYTLERSGDAWRIVKS